MVWRPIRYYVLLGTQPQQRPYDQGVNYVATRGETIGGTSNPIEGVANVPLRFTYLNAGYINPIAGTPVSHTAITMDEGAILIDRKGNAPTQEVVDRKTCGDGSCDGGETACNCYEDCGGASGSCGLNGWQCGEGVETGGNCFCDAACANPENNDCCQDKQMICGC